MELIVLYIFFTGLIYVSWRLNSEDPIWRTVLYTFFGFILGWIVTPILIGRAIRKIYKDKYLWESI